MASETTRDDRVAGFLRDADLSPPETIPKLAELEVFDFEPALPSNADEARLLLVKQRTSEPGYQQPDGQRRHLFRTKGQKAAACDEDKWVFTKHEVAKTLDALLSETLLPSPGIAQAVLSHASITSLDDLWYHLHDPKLEKKMSKRFSRQSTLPAVPNITWLDDIVSQENIEYIRLLCQADLGQESLDRAFGLALSKHSMDAMSVLLGFGAVASAFKNGIRERVKLDDVAFAKLLLSVPDAMTVAAWQFCIEPEVEVLAAGVKQSPNILLLCLAHRPEVIHNELLLKALQSQNIQAMAVILAYATSGDAFRDVYQRACELASSVQDNDHRHDVFKMLDNAGFLSDDPILREELMKDVKARHLPLIRIMANAGVSLDNQAYNVFYWAVSNMDLDILDLFRCGVFSSPVSLALNLVPDSAPEEDVMRLVDILSYQGLSGDPLDMCLVRAVRKQQSQLVTLLLHHGASVEFEQASAIRVAMDGADFNILSVLLRSQCSPQVLSATIPTAMGLQPRSNRLETMKAVLEKGIIAQKLGVPLQSLISEQGDVDSELIQLLLQHDAPPDGVSDAHNNPIMVATRRGIIHVLHMLCEAGPANTTLSAAVPIAFEERKNHGQVALDIVELLIRNGARGPPVDQTLLTVVEEDPRLDVVSLLVGHGADANHAAGASYRVAIERGAITVLETLCAGCAPTQASIESLLTTIIDSRYYKPEILQLLLGSATPVAAADALNASWSSDKFKGNPNANEIIPSFLRHGLDVNLGNGILLCFAIQEHNTALLGDILAASPSIPSLTAAFQAAVGVHPRDFELDTMKRLLEHANSAEIGQSKTLLPETHTAMGGSFVGLKLLLHHHAAVDTDNGKVVQEAATAESVEVLDLLLSFKPSSPTLDMACLSAAASTRTPDQKHNILQRLLAANTEASPESMSILLDNSIEAFPNFAILPELLMARGGKIKAKTFRTALEKSSREVFVLLVGNRRSSNAATLMFRFARAVKMDPERRYWIYEYLLNRKVASDDVSDALVDSLKVDDLGDLSLPKLLLEHGATVGHKEGAPFAAALRANSLDATKLLSQYIIDDTMAGIAFTLAAHTPFLELNMRLEIYRCMLQWNISKSSTSDALLDSFENGYSTVPLVQLLLDKGADPNENNAHCFAVASRTEVEPQFRALSKRAELTVVLQSLLDHFQEEWEVVWWFGVCLEEQPNWAKIEQDELIFQCMRRFPWGTALLNLLLDNGVLPSAKITHSIFDGWKPEPCTVLIWALFSTPRIENEPILALLSQGGKQALPAYSTLTTKVSAAFGCLLDETRTPVLEALFKLDKDRILENMMLGSTFGHLAAYPTVSNEEFGFFDDSNEIYLREAALYLGNFDAFRLIKLKETPNDGTLHLAALLALPKFVKYLMEVHDPDKRAEEYDFMIPLALACESKPVPWCKIANGEADWLIRQKQTMELLVPKTKLSWRYRHKSVLHIALDNGPEVTRIMVAALDICHDPDKNEKYMFVDRSGLHYSPDHYVKEILEVDEGEKWALTQCLAAGKMQSRYYRTIVPNAGSQPVGYCGLPPTLQKIWAAHEAELIRKDLRGAKPHLELALETPASDARGDCYFYRSRCCFQLAMYAEARDVLLVLTFRPIDGVASTQAQRYWLGRSLQELGDDNAAKPHLEAARKLAKEGWQHFLECHHFLGRAHFATASHEKAKYYFQLVIWKANQKPIHLVTMLRSQYYLGRCYFEMRSFVESRNVLRAALNKQLRQMPGQTLDIISTRYHLARSYLQCGASKEAQRMFELVLPFFESLSETGDPTIVNVRFELGYLAYRYKEWLRALSFLQEAMIAHETVHVNSSLDVAKCQDMLATTLRLLKRYDESSQLYQHILDKHKERLKSPHQLIVDAQSGLCLALFYLNDSPKAWPMAQEALNWQEELSGAEDYKCLHVQLLLGRLAY